MLIAKHINSILVSTLAKTIAQQNGQLAIAKPSNAVKKLLKEIRK